LASRSRPMSEFVTPPGQPGSLDDEYNPRARIPEFADYFARWKMQAAEARNSLHPRMDLRYGDSPLETLDFFGAGGVNGPLLIFIHGGYWRSADKADFSWVAPAYVSAGFSVAIVNYGLLPATPLEEIVRQIRRACIWLYRNAATLGFDPHRMVCAGHSAGGHLAAMMLTAQWQAFSAGLPDQLLKAVVAISGLFDLLPLTHAEFLREDLGLDELRARHLSPAHLPLRNSARLLLAVGALESQEFKRQSDSLAAHWAGAGACELLLVQDCNHFSVCDAFSDPNSVLFKRTSALMPSGKAP
jgi:arylformamidase